MTRPGADGHSHAPDAAILDPGAHQGLEAVQDSVGAWFADLGLVRRKRRAEAIREARGKVEELPKRRYHAKTWKCWAEEKLRLKAKAEELETERASLETREARMTERENEAEIVLAVAEGVASGAFAIETRMTCPD